MTRHFAAPTLLFVWPSISIIFEESLGACAGLRHVSVVGLEPEERTSRVRIRVRDGPGARTVATNRKPDRVHYVARRLARCILCCCIELCLNALCQ